MTSEIMWDWCNGPSTWSSALNQLIANLPTEYNTRLTRKRLPSGLSRFHSRHRTARINMFHRISYTAAGCVDTHKGEKESGFVYTNPHGMDVDVPGESPLSVQPIRP